MGYVSKIAYKGAMHQTPKRIANFQEAHALVLPQHGTMQTPAPQAPYKSRPAGERVRAKSTTFQRIHQPDMKNMRASKVACHFDANAELPSPARCRSMPRQEEEEEAELEIDLDDVMFTSVVCASIEIENPNITSKLFAREAKARLGVEDRAAPVYKRANFLSRKALGIKRHSKKEREYLKEQGREHELSPGRSPKKCRNINKPTKQANGVKTYARSLHHFKNSTKVSHAHVKAQLAEYMQDREEKLLEEYYEHLEAEEREEELYEAYLMSRMNEVRRMGGEDKDAKRSDEEYEPEWVLDLFGDELFPESDEEDEFPWVYELFAPAPVTEADVSEAEELKYVWDLFADDSDHDSRWGSAFDEEESVDEFPWIYDLFAPLEPSAPCVEDDLFWDDAMCLYGLVDNSSVSTREPEEEEELWVDLFENNNNKNFVVMKDAAVGADDDADEWVCLMDLAM